MRSSEPLRRLISASRSIKTREILPVYQSCRCLHSTRRLEKRRVNPSKSSIDAPEKAYTNHLLPQNELSIRHGRPKRREAQNSAKNVHNYTREELESLRGRYTPEQFEAIRAGEEGISPQDIVDQGIVHNGPMTLDYLDDFSKHRPVVDKAQKAPSIIDPKTGKPPKFKWKTERELADDLEKWLDEQPEDGGEPYNWYQFTQNVKVYTGEQNLEAARSSEAPKISTLDDPIAQALARASAADGNQEDRVQAENEALAKQTGLTVEQIRTIRVKVLVTRFVVNQTRLGKARSTYLLAVAGNGDGLLGLGEGKAQEGKDAIAQTVREAVRNVRPIRRYENRTIYGNVKGKSGATELELFSRRPGFGSRGQSLIWEMCKMAGIKDISARVTRSRNPMNIVKATYNALLSQQYPEEIAMGRGRRMVDLRKVYYGGRNA